MRTFLLCKYAAAIAITAVLLSASYVHAEDAGGEKKWTPIQLFMENPVKRPIHASGIFLDRDVKGLRLGLNYSYGIDDKSGTRVVGLDLGFPNSVNHGTTGIMLAPLATVTYGNSTALQIAGLANFNYGQSFAGVQIAGIANISRHDFNNSLQLSIFYNQNAKTPKEAPLSLICLQAGIANGCVAKYAFQIGLGSFAVSGGFLQANALINSAAVRAPQIKNTHGAQIGGALINYAESYRGVQIGGLLNFATTSLTGLQVAAINRVYNTRERRLENGNNAKLTGAQIGIVNLADEVRGIQIGLINAAYKLKGLQVGVVNLHFNGPISFMPLLNIGF